MDGIASIIIAVITTAGTIAVAYIAARRVKNDGTVVPSPNEASLRLVADTHKAEAEIWRGKYEEAVADRARADAIHERKVELLQHDKDECERQLSNLYSELRATGRVQDRRATPRED